MDRQQIIGQRIRQAREELKMSQEDLGRMYGCSDAHISRIENGRVNIGIGDVERFAVVLGKNRDWLLSSNLEAPKRPIEAIISEFQRATEQLEMVEIPQRGAVPAGRPATEDEVVEGYIKIPRVELNGVANVKSLYALRVSGDSLEGDEIYTGDMLVIEPTVEILDGRIYVVRMGNEVCARHVFKQNDHLRLVSSNGNYQDIKATEVEILGRVVLSGRWKKH